MAEQPGSKRIITLFIDIGGMLLSGGWGHKFHQQASNHLNTDLSGLDKRHLLIFATYELGKLSLSDYLNFYTLLRKTMGLDGWISSIHVCSVNTQASQYYADSLAKKDVPANGCGD